MRILFAISVVAFVALVWASVSAAQHIRRARRRREMIRSGLHAGPLEAATADLVPWLVEEANPEQATTAANATTTAEAPSSPVELPLPVQTEVAPPPPRTPEPAQAAPALPPPILFPLSSHRVARLNQPRPDAGDPAQGSREGQPASEASARRNPVPFAPPRRPERSSKDAEQAHQQPAPRFRERSR